MEVLAAREAVGYNGMSETKNGNLRVPVRLTVLPTVLPTNSENVD